MSESMARPIRKKSVTGIYHVMLRGINRQDIFEDDKDYLQMTTVLKGVTGISFDVIQKLLTVRKMISRTDPVILGLLTIGGINKTIKQIYDD